MSFLRVLAAILGFHATPSPVVPLTLTRSFWVPGSLKLLPPPRSARNTTRPGLNQRQLRKNARRAHAAGKRHAFS